MEIIKGLSMAANIVISGMAFRVIVFGDVQTAPSAVAFITCWFVLSIAGLIADFVADLRMSRKLEIR